MSTDIHDTARPDTAGIRLDVARHTELFAAIGCDSLGKIAAETGVTERTVRRARQGIIGEVFIAQTIAALQRNADALAAADLKPPTLDELFTVVTKAAV
ncbi:hypothetical protein [Micromonospora endolithica]|uniref:XRE family transcriptional regulator n=1 Tax=Micromonospora endolithica TaxID=230091 RepID=A0A3A9ZA65_9ACTN|nr:hypothetical protein [Micromonospora endolithica]RKN45233.1 hypothetical protein D7223_16445 [Micromonospora endolithica]TWJ23091.1 hypothetical protein JD76_03220 [Micromonospora endolithica]